MSFTWREIQQYGFGRCNKCGEWKSADNFRDKKKYCKSCSSKAVEEYLKNNPQKAEQYRKQRNSGSNERSKRYRETIIGKAKVLAGAAIGRARREKMQCNITWQVVYVMMFLQDFKCSQTGIPFDFITSGTSSKHRKLCAPSIDKIIPENGYVVENIQIVCWFYNAAKGTNTDEELWKLMFAAVRNRENS